MFVAFYDFIYARLVGTDSINFFTYLSSGWMWFLKYLFVCSLVAYISRKIFKNDILAAMIPTIMLILLTRSTIFRLLPFLWIGYFMNKHSEKLFANVRALMASSAILFVGFLCFWKGDYDVALRIVSLKNGIDFNFTNFLIFIERFGVGLCGSIFFISVIKIVTEWYSESRFIAFCEKIGRNTLGIYCLQIYVLEFGLSHIDLKLHTPFSIVIQIALALGVLLTCHFITELLKRNKYTSLLFLGQKKSVRP